jgi:hypothetical protein
MLCLALLLLFPFALLPLAVAGCTMDDVHYRHPARVYHLWVQPDGRPVPPAPQPSGK